MQIQKIIYNTTRELMEVKEKMSIASLIIFCYEKGSVDFANLLYCKNKELLVNQLTKEYEGPQIDFMIDFSNSGVRNSLSKTIEKLIEVYDKDKFYKAVYNKDEFALATVELTSMFYNKVNKE